LIILFQQQSIQKQVSNSTGINSSRQYKGFSLRGIFYQQLIEMLLGGHGVQDLLETIYKNIRLPVMIISSAGEVLHYAGYDQCPGLVLTRSFLSLEQHKFSYEEKPKKYSFEIDGKSIECLVLPLLQRKGNMAYLIVATQRKNVNRPMLELLQAAAQVLALEMDREVCLYFFETKYQTEFILDILMDENPKKEKLKLASRVCGRNLEEPHLVFVAAFTPGEYKLKEKSTQIFKSNLKLIMGHNFLDLAHGDWHVVLVPEKSKNLQDIIDLMRQVHRKTNMELPEGTRLFTACQSLMRREYNLGKGYKEARFSLELGLSTGGGDSFIQFDKVGISGLLYNMCQNPASANILSEYSKGKLGRLINNDMLHKTELYSTLSVYLENNGNITVTAEKLFIHPNTLRYRINKIEKLLKTDLSNFESIVELSIAYKIDQLLNSI
jgi:sugar diacid utilization regulator